MDVRSDICEHDAPKRMRLVLALLALSQALDADFRVCMGIRLWPTLICDQYSSIAMVEVNDFLKIWTIRFSSLAFACVLIHFPTNINLWHVYAVYNIAQI